MLTYKKSLGALAGLMLLGTAYASCPYGTTPFAGGTVDGKEACELQGRYTFNMVLDSSRYWLLAGGVFIGNNNKDNATLTIQPGTTIVGKSGADFLVITRGSKIIAEGSADRPIVFTAAKKQGRSRGLWGGLIINGNAPINSCMPGSAICEAEGEGFSGLYGGNDPYDNSGVLKYVRVEWAGYQITPENELNGIAFQGVGAGTTVDYVQIHMAADDGIEFFGGSVNVKHVVVTGAIDDSLDWTSGWQGKAQFVLIEQIDGGNHGIEADNNEKKHDIEPRSNPELANMTMIGTTDARAEGGAGMLLRRGTGVSVYNTLITGFKSGCLRIDDAETYRNGGTLTGSVVEPAGLKMVNTLVQCAQNYVDKSTNPYLVSTWFNSQPGNQAVNPSLNGWVPAPGSIALTSGAVTPEDLFFDDVDFIGAVKDESSNWTTGWTTLVKD